METFPAFYPLKGARVVIAGEGPPAEAKARLFESSPATVVIVTGEAARDPASYAGATLVFIASYDAALALGAAAAARRGGAPINVVDHPEVSDFHTPAIIDRGAVVAAIGTAGAAPLLASMLRAEIETRVPASAGRIAALLGERRTALRAAFPDLAQRRAFLRGALAGPVAEAAVAGEMALAAERLDDAISAGWKAVGRISVILAPTDDDLLSLRAVRALNVADVVVDMARSDAILAGHARRDAEYLAPEAATKDALIALAREGRLVAVITARVDPDLAERLRDADVPLDMLTPAPAS